MWRFSLLLCFLSLHAEPLLLEADFPAGSGPDSYVRTIAVLPDQGILAGGNFARFNGLEVSSLVRLRPDGSLDPEFHAGPFLYSSQAAVSHLEVAKDGRIVVSGIFTNVGGFTAPNVAVLRTDGSVDETFHWPDLLPNTATIGLVPAPDGGFWARGSFTNIGGITSPRIAKLDANGSVDATFRSPFTAIENSIPTLLSLPDGKLLLTGSFTNLSGTGATHIARLLPTGEVDESFETDLPEETQISRVVLMPDRSLIGTASSTSGLILDEPTTLLRLNPDGKIDRMFNPRFQLGGTYTTIFSRVLVLLPETDGSLIIGGSFLEINGVTRYTLARLLPDGNLALCFDPGLGVNGFPLALAEQADGRILVGGVFRAVEGQNRPYLARLKAEGECAPGTLAFSSIEYRVSEAAPSALITVVRSGAATSAEVLHVRATGATARAGEDYNGEFFEVRFAPGERAQSISIRLRQDGIAEPEETVQLSLESATAPLAQPRSATLRILDETQFRASGAVDTEFRPRVAGPVLAAALSPAGNWLIATGKTNANGLFDYTGFELAEFGANGNAIGDFVGTNSFDGEITKISFYPDGRFLVGGDFQNVNGSRLPGLARFDEHGVLEEGFQPLDSFSSINTFIQPSVRSFFLAADGTIMAAGDFPEVQDSPTGYRLVRILPDGRPDEAFLQNQAREVAGASSLAREEDGSWIFGTIGENSTLARIDPFGRRDARFIPPPFTPAVLEALLVLSDHSILGAGTGSASFGLGLATPGLARFAPNGGALRPFQQNCALDLSNSVFSRLLQDSQERIMISGKIKIGGSSWPATVVRLHADGSLDPSFDAGSGAFGRVLTGTTNIIEPNIRVLEAFPDGGWLVGGDFAGFDGVAQPFLVRLLPRRQAPVSIHLLASEWSFSESAGELRVDVVRQGSADAASSVRFRTLEGTARSGSDFTAVNDVIDFAPGEWSRQVSIPITANTRAESNRVFTVTLMALDTPISQPSSAEVQIEDDDINVEFIADDFEVREGELFARVGVRRTGFSTRQIRAVVNAEGRSYSLLLPGSDGYAVTNFVEIPVPDDDRYTPDRRLMLSVATVDNIATTGSRSAAVLNITENDFPEDPGRGVAGYINAVSAAPQGGVYIAGKFSALDGRQRGGIARLLPTGEADEAFDPGSGTDGTVNALAVQSDGSVFIGGDFSSVDGTPRAQVARLLPDGKLDPVFSPGTGPASQAAYPARILALSVAPEGSVWVGGRFTSFDGVPGVGLVRLQRNGAVDLAFTSPLRLVASRLNPFLAGFPPTVTEIHARPAGGLLLLGELSYVTGSSKFGQGSGDVIALNANGSVDTNFVTLTPPGTFTTAIPLADGSYLAGSRWSRATRPPSQTGWAAIQKLNSTGAVDPSFVVRSVPEVPATSSVIRRLLIDNQGRVLFVAELGGTNFGNYGATVLARLLPEGTWDQSFQWAWTTNTMAATPVPIIPRENVSLGDAEIAASIRGFALQSDGTLVLAGNFTEINREPRARLARLNPDGTLRGSLRLEAALVASGAELRVPGEVPFPYVVQVSTDIASWSPLLTNTAPYLSWRMAIDPPEPGNHRFYRAVSTDRTKPGGTARWFHQATELRRAERAHPN